MPARVTIYSKRGCHLCDEMSAIVRRIGRDVPVDLEEIDITDDPDLERRYGASIPVLLADGRMVAKSRVTEEALRRALSGAGTRPG